MWILFLERYCDIEKSAASSRVFSVGTSKLNISTYYKQTQYVSVDRHRNTLCCEGKLRGLGKCTPFWNRFSVFLWFWQQHDKKKKNDLVSSFDFTTESQFAVSILLLSAKIISAITWLTTLIKNKTRWHTRWRTTSCVYSCEGHSESMWLLNQSIWLLSEVCVTRPPPSCGHISVYRIHMISGFTLNTIHILVSLGDPSKAVEADSPS